MLDEKLYRKAVEAAATYPQGLAAQIKLLGGTRAAANIAGVGIREVQLWLAYLRKDDPTPPKHVRRIGAPAQKKINAAVNALAVAAVIAKFREKGIVAALDGYLTVSENKRFKREMAGVLITYAERDEENRALLTLLCDAALAGKWGASASWFEEAFLQAYDFEEASFDDIDTLTLRPGAEKLQVR